MDDIQLQETIERYLTDLMSVEERAQFEAICKATPEVEQMVIEHAMFLREMDIYVNRKNFSKLNKQVFNQLLNAGTWTPATEQSTSFKVIQLWSKYKKVTAIAASVGGFIALFTSAMMLFFFPSINGNQILELSKAVEKIEQNQKVQTQIIELTWQINQEQVLQYQKDSHQRMPKSLVQALLHLSKL